MKKRIISLILFLITFSFAFATTTSTSPLIKYKSGDSSSTKTGSFTVTFEGSTEGVLYSDIGFSLAETTVQKSGLEKTKIANNALTMTYSSRDITSETKTYTYKAQFYIYWYVSLNKAMTLTLKMTPADGAEVTITGKKYEYKSTGASGAETSTLTWSNNSAVIASFGSIISVYHGNSLMDVTAKLSKYPVGNVIATLTLELTSP